MTVIYLDACCFNRPFDDQSQDRIRLETEAVIVILKYTRLKKLSLLESDVLRHEISKISEYDRRFKIELLLKYASKTIKLNPKIRSRAYEFEEMGFKGFDALHLASAESGNVNAFLTTDDKLIKLSKKNQDSINLLVENPIVWISELFNL